MNWKQILLVVLLLASMLTACGGESTQPTGESNQPSYACNQLDKNNLFSSYPNSTQINNPADWQTSYGSDSARIETVMPRLQRSGGKISGAVGSWLSQNPLNIQVYDGLVNGAAMATVVREGETEPVLAIGSTFLAKGDDAELAIHIAHEAVHLEDLKSSKTDGQQTHALCKEMRAYAFETALYAEFRAVGYSQPTMEENYNLLNNADWRWQTQEWADRVKAKFGVSD